MESTLPSSQCPSCQAANRASARFCGACGGELRAAKYCSSCGKPNSATARFCGGCAASFTPSSSAAASAPPDLAAQPLRAAAPIVEAPIESGAQFSGAGDHAAPGFADSAKDFLTRAAAYLADAVQSGKAAVTRLAAEKPYAFWGAAIGAGIVLATGVGLLIWHESAAPVASVASNQGLVGTPSGVQYATRLTHIRNGPTSIGTTVLDDIQAGESVSGVWVLGRDGVTNWLRVVRADGSYGFLWGRNLSTAPPSKPAPGASFGEFTAYPVALYTGALAPPDFRNSPASFSRFRTVIRQGASAGVNFAGHYTIVTFGCGAGCSSSVLVDGQTGLMSDFPLGGEGFYVLRLNYRADSQLIVAQWVSNPSDATPSCISEEFLMVGTAFNALRKQQRPGYCPS